MWPIRICITFIPPLPPLPSPPLPSPPLPLVTQQIHCPFQHKQSPSSQNHPRECFNTKANKCHWNIGDKTVQYNAKVIFASANRAARISNATHENRTQIYTFHRYSQQQRLLVICVILHPLWCRGSDHPVSLFHHMLILMVIGSNLTFSSKRLSITPTDYQVLHRYAFSRRIQARLRPTARKLVGV